MRLSKYAVISDSEYRRESSMDRLKLIYSTRTGKLIPVPKRLADDLASSHYESITSDERDELASRQILVADTASELDEIVDENERAASETSHRRFSLLPSRYCNMGCGYCGQEHLRQNLTPRHRDSVKQRVLAAIDDDQVERIDVNWFGGEPMMGYPIIQDMAKTFTKACDVAGKTYSSKMISNGTLLTLERLHTLVEDCRISFIEITIDGPRDVHDKQRLLKNGSGSFDHIIELLRAAKSDSRLSTLIFGLRTNVTQESAQHVSEYLRYMADQGLTGPAFAYSIHEVHNWGNDAHSLSLERADFAAQELVWMDYMAQRDMAFEVLPGKRRKIVCVATTKSAEIVSSTGRIFSCSEHPLVPGFETTHAVATLDDLQSSARRPAGEFDDWHDDVRRGDSSPCGTCTFYPVCGGFCPKQWREETVTCPGFKTNIQGRLDVVAKTNGLLKVT